MSPREGTTHRAAEGPADRVSSIKKETIFVKLTDEIVAVWRPVSAVKLSANVFRILPEDFDPDVETWEFLPGEAVTVEERVEPEGKSLIAVARATTKSR